MKNAFYILFLIALGTAQSFAQSIKNFNLLKGEKEVEVIFNYDNLRVQKENYTEEEYIKKHSANLEKKANGSSADWKVSWNQSKENAWPAKFLFEANMHSKYKVKFTRNAPKSKYVLLVDVYWIYSGWDAGVINQPAKVTTVIKLVPRENLTEVLAQLMFNEIKGNQFANYSNEVRIREGFAKTGKKFGKKVVKYLK
ncbi:hypothetical protein HX004_12815 [Myroides sp. 1354]|uniref:hypothetical protein n=1 Tax=unclassified Myroides TaxID=2642485 RepID=UPI0025750B32|nr:MULTISPECIES: hypothetical protein [unclassified Myroides]MDM1045652.1 hypothetical protein [Myroides sp. R163-1]MDM1056654.1 hypothetical protein [Myroides sp. 1354]MDM1069782.1 hypothetical protein [Myroides sp. 1372]